MILLRTLNLCFTKLLYTLINVLAKMLYIILFLSAISSAVIILNLEKSFPKKSALICTPSARLQLIDIQCSRSKVQMCR